ncbi:MAG TPA: carboxypeptidase regulatory-like domain-containing protein [Candidatus Acidoferrales bacterium]|nr:carboxypeptidase regulatory-like domain-containing protein [Candidatus Acidoferrales bacterium]
MMKGCNRFIPKSAAISVLLLAALVVPQLASAQGRGGRGQQQSQSDASDSITAGPAPGQVSGHILRADTGEPLPKATVMLTFAPVANQPRGQQAVENRVVRSGADGSFTITDVEPSTYNLRAEHPGFVAQLYGQDTKHPQATRITVSPGQNVDSITVRLGAAGIVSGSVSDEDNEPVQNIQVSAVKLRFLPGGRQITAQSRTATTDDLGNYRLSDLQPGSYFVRAGGQFIGQRATSYSESYYPGASALPDAQRIVVPPGNEVPGVNMAVRADATHNITGVITDATASGSRRRYIVQVMRNNVGMGGSMARPDGSFVIRGVGSGDYTVIAMYAGGGPQDGGDGAVVDMTGMPSMGYATVHVDDSDAQVAVQIGRPSEIRGRVILDGATRGQAIPGVNVQVQPWDQDAFGAPFVRTGGGRGGPNGGPQSGMQLDENGGFVIQNLPPGRYTLTLAGAARGYYAKRITCGGRDYATQPMELDSGSNIDNCEIVIANDTASVNGFVMDGNTPAAGLVVIAIPQSKQLRQIARFTGTANTDQNGQFQISGLVPGDYYIFATAEEDDGGYYAPDFPERNQSTAFRITLKPSDSPGLTLSPMTPR